MATEVEIPGSLIRSGQLVKVWYELRRSSGASSDADGNNSSSSSNRQVIDSSEMHHNNNEPFSFVVGSNVVLPAINNCVQKMRKGDKMEFRCEADACFGAVGNRRLNVAPNEELILTLHVIDVEGLQRLKDGFHNEKLTDEAQILKMSLLLNMCACYLKPEMKMFDKVVSLATQVLSLDGNNVKAYFRRAQAYLGKNKQEEAMDDLILAKKLDPKNEEVVREYQKLSKEIQAIRNKEKKIFGKMFGGE